MKQRQYDVRQPMFLFRIPEKYSIRIQKNEHRVKWIRNDNDNRMVSMKNPRAVADRGTIIVIKIPFYFLSNRKSQSDREGEERKIRAWNWQILFFDYNGWRDFSMFCSLILNASVSRDIRWKKLKPGEYHFVSGSDK